MPIRRIIHSICLVGILIIFLAFNIFAQDTEIRARFESEYEQWKEMFMNSISSNSYNEHMGEIIKLGIPALPVIFDKMKKEELGCGYHLEIAIRQITKKHFEREDWPKDKLGDAHTAAAMYIGWWEKDIKNTEKIFNQYYSRLTDNIDKGNLDDADKEMNHIKNLGIAAFPYMIDKIRDGDIIFIQIISQHTNNDLDENASKEQCLEWWEKNKDRYTIVYDK